MIENIAHQEKRWVLYLHTVSKELSGYDHDKYYVGISSNLKIRYIEAINGNILKILKNLT